MLRELQPCRNAARCRRTHNDLPCGPVHSRTHPQSGNGTRCERDRKSTRLNSSHVSISYAVFCLKKKKVDEREESLDLSSHGWKREVEQTTSAVETTTRSV